MSPKCHSELSAKHHFNHEEPKFNSIIFPLNTLRLLRVQACFPPIPFFGFGNGPIWCQSVEKYRAESEVKKGTHCLCVIVVVKSSYSCYCERNAQCSPSAGLEETNTGGTKQSAISAHSGGRQPALQGVRLLRRAAGIQPGVQLPSEAPHNVFPCDI